MSRQAKAGAPPPHRPPERRWLLLLLTLAMTLNYLDRFVVSILLEPIRAELRLSDLQIGVLTGGAFALFYSGLALPMARLAEWRNRIGILSASLLLWSLATALCGAARGFGSLLATRVLVGCGEAGAVPPAQSMVGDLYPPDRRASAMSVLGLSAPLGVMLAPLLGGTLNDAVGWRATFVVIGLPGLLLAAVMARTLRDPARGGADGIRADGVPAPFGIALRRLARRPAFLWLGAALALMAIAEYGTFIWVAPLLTRTLHVSAAALGRALFVFQGLPYLLATWLGGQLVDRAYGRDVRWIAWVPMAATAMAAPAIVGLSLSRDNGLAYLLLIVPSFANGLYLGPCWALIQGLAAARSRATATAVLVFAVNVVGAGIGPVMIGGLSDLLGRRYGPLALQHAFLALAPIYLLGLLAFGLLARSLKAGFADVAAEEARPALRPQPS